MVKLMFVAVVLFLVFFIIRGIKKYKKSVKEETALKNEVDRGKNLNTKARTSVHKKKNDAIKNLLDDDDDDTFDDEVFVYYAEDVIDDIVEEVVEVEQDDYHSSRSSYTAPDPEPTRNRGSYDSGSDYGSYDSDSENYD